MRQEDPELSASLGHTARACFNNKKKQCVQVGSRVESEDGHGVR